MKHTKRTSNKLDDTFVRALEGPARFLPIVLGSLTAIVVFAFVRVLAGTTAGLYAALIFSVSVPIDQSLFIAYKMNDKILTRDRGYPLRVIAPGLTGSKNVKAKDYDKLGFVAEELTSQNKTKFKLKNIDKGVIITSVKDNSSAQEAGLKIELLLFCYFSTLKLPNREGIYKLKPN